MFCILVSVHLQVVIRLLDDKSRHVAVRRHSFGNMISVWNQMSDNCSVAHIPCEEVSKVDECLGYQLSHQIGKFLNDVLMVKRGLA